MRIDSIRLIRSTTCAYVENLSKLKSRDGVGGSKVFRLKEPGVAITIILEINSRKYRGDAVSVQYANIYGRSSPIQRNTNIFEIENYLSKCIPKNLPDGYREACEVIEGILVGFEFKIPICYGISQALLKAVMHAQDTDIRGIIKEEYGFEPNPTKPRILIQTNKHDLETIRSALELEPDILPHANFCTEELLGKSGELFLDYFSNVVNLINDYRIENSYKPALHFDLYGTLGEIFDSDMSAVIEYIGVLSKIADDLELQIESPVILTEREAHFEYIRLLKQNVRSNFTNVKIILDEWANTLDDIKVAVDAEVADIVQIKMPDLGSITNSISAVIHCSNKNVKAYLGGTSNETVESALITTEVACALSPSQVLAKPGMDVNCGLSLVRNCLEAAYAQ